LAKHSRHATLPDRQAHAHVSASGLPIDQSSGPMKSRILASLALCFVLLAPAASRADGLIDEVKLGLMADSGGVLRLPQRLPRAIATELLLTGRRMGAAEALRWGLVNQVAAPDQLMPAALALAQTLVGNAPLAQAAIKEVLRHTQGLATEAGYQMLRHHDLPAYRAMLRSEDAAEGPRAFGEKRPPNWRGV